MRQPEFGLRHHNTAGSFTACGEASTRADRSLSHRGLEVNFPWTVASLLQNSPVFVQELNAFHFSSLRLDVLKLLDTFRPNESTTHFKANI